ncbi:hypothetical protein IscW_ISCW010207 [Ixodes scapularis]|uniref:Uncharacterized protein n=1 Tax=Ixodes scapularis TaxID=6945 RepID=B7Q087_IXOSC|nr:hypothetical protein IscW_ISCW010207 [Ixodes scapularis]|eukprot:XP_002407208.1 hypothetical protein IscW_ISCW010207 [Ixodes scapularis]
MALCTCMQFLEPLCEQLFAFFNSTEDALSQFAHFFLPCVLGVYFSSLHKKDRKQILDNEGKPTTNTYGIPSMSKPSIYHEVCVSTGSLFSHRDTHALRAAGRLPLRSVILFRQHHRGTVTKVTAVASRLAPHCHHHR